MKRLVAIEWKATDTLGLISRATAKYTSKQGLKAARPCGGVFKGFDDRWHAAFGQVRYTKEFDKFGDAEVSLGQYDSQVQAQRALEDYVFNLARLEAWPSDRSEKEQ